MNEKLEKFKDLLKEIFEIDKSDLNFGIYRIINLRKDRIEGFINETLPNEINNVLNTISDANKAEELASDVYSALYSFFNRYYDEGDFISKRRYKEGVYAIPYEGEEVKLYWANYDQYYIKTSEDFKDYEFKTNDGITCKFKLIDVTTEQNNNKEKDDEKRKFMLYKKGDSDDKTIETFSYDKENKVLTICFIYDIPESKNTHIKSDELEQDIKEWIDSNAGDIGPSIFAQQDVADKKTKTLLKKHLDAYIAKNTFDYFIHKDLKKFLDRELDFFIKTEIMHLDDLNTENEKQLDQYILKVKAIKKVGQVIIDFLASVENFQKKLWLKKKFIIETNWCISLDKISDEFYEEIRNNKEQINEWIDLYAINEVDGFTEAPSIAFLKNNNNLIVDTKNFSKDFKERLLATIENLDNNTNGLLINGDNFHAIRILNKLYANRINCVYIDPPFNAKSSEILYKNNFKHSSWLSLMNDRILQSKKLLLDNFVYIIAIDEAENNRLASMCDYIFADQTGNKCISVVINPSGQQGKNFSVTNEFLHFYYNDGIECLAKEDRKGLLKTSKNAILDNEIEDGENEIKPDIRDFMNSSKGESGDYKRETGKTCFYPIYVKENKIIGFGDVCEDDFHPQANVKRDDGVIEVYPVDNDNVERKWLFGRDTVENILSELQVNVKSDGKIQIKRVKYLINYKTVWTNKLYSAKTYGTTMLGNMFGRKVFTFPKSIYAVKDCVNIALNNVSRAIVLDFFGGSGTTANAVMDLCDLDKKYFYITVEMGEYFNTATLPRIKKASFCHYLNWKDGKPTIYNEKNTICLKYFNIESYEDVLSNITLNDNLSSFFIDNIEYTIDLDTKYSLLSIDKFKRPFDYKMKITSKNETKETNIDMVETFNYLIGLTVNRQYAIRYFNVGDITDSPYKGAISLKEISINEANNGTIRFKEIYGILRDGRKAVIVWRDVNDNVENSNAALDAFFINHMNSKEFDVLFINGDNNVQNLKKDNDNWNTELIEPKFNELMFEEE